MKLFSSERFTKPGKGVDKNEKPKPAFIRFFITLWNKRNKLLGINFIYFLFAIPAVLVAVFGFIGAFSLYDMFDTSVNLGEILATNETASALYFKTILFFGIFFTCIPVFSSGPMYAGFTFILKSFYKEEPVFLWHDFITKARSNVKLGLQTMFFNLICGLLIMLNGMAYMVISNPNNPLYNGYIPWFVLFIFAAVTIFFAVLLTMMNLYMYPMMVTFRVTFKQMMRNSFVLCLMKWLPNIGIILLDVLLIGIPVYLLPTYNFTVFIVCIILYAVVFPSFIGLVNMFFIYPVFKKYLIDNPGADKSEKPADEQPREQVPVTKPTGRFENGMWISYEDETSQDADDADDSQDGYDSPMTDDPALTNAADTKEKS
ncbi:MAG: hypothetical protein IJS71_01825 [Clostridia bacterium]|nr:hypothetical protein [Clostridia bacterium]